VLTQSTAGQSAGPTDPAGLVLERLPSGDYAWLRPWLGEAIRDAGQVDQFLTRLLERRPEPLPEPDETRIALTQRGRDLLARWRAEVALFGREVTA
jgi:hypothetical protein